MVFHCCRVLRTVCTMHLKMMGVTSKLVEWQGMMTNLEVRLSHACTFLSLEKEAAENFF